MAKSADVCETSVGVRGMGGGGEYVGREGWKNEAGGRIPPVWVLPATGRVGTGGIAEDA